MTLEAVGRVGLDCDSDCFRSAWDLRIVRWSSDCRAERLLRDVMRMADGAWQCYQAGRLLRVVAAQMRVDPIELYPWLCVHSTIAGFDGRILEPTLLKTWAPKEVVVVLGTGG